MTSYENELMKNAKEIGSQFRSIFDSGDCISAPEVACERLE